MRRFALLVTWFAGSLVSALPCAAEVTAEKTDRGVVVKIDGAMFTEYLTRCGTKPVLWPILGPTGKPMTRAYPMGEAPGERKDHVHQRSLWFTHGSVGGVNFWDEVSKGHGSIAHRKFVKVDSGPQAVIVAENDWLAADGKRVCEDVRTLTFGRDGPTRWIDFDLVLKASDAAVAFGDTKEGAFGVRIAETIKVDAKLGGRIVNSEGQIDAKAWGQRAAWVDYYGPVEGQTVGIAILNHPSSFRFPTWWHVRSYGLFAANPFGVKDFTGGKGDGNHTLPQGESLRLRYRLLFHKGDEKEGRVAETFARYAQAK
jgi:hypothetical protein